jgi:hypothetical protein
VATLTSGSPFLPAGFWSHRADAYISNDATGRRDKPVGTNIRCRLNSIQMQGAASGDARRQLNAMRKLLLHPDFDLQDTDMRFVVWPADGTRTTNAQAWNLIPGSVADAGPDEGLAMKLCEVVRARNAPAS